MRYVTAVRHLETVGETATADLRLKDTSIGYPLEELWVGGDVLEGLPVVRPSDDQLRHHSSRKSLSTGTPPRSVFRTTQ